MGAKVVTAQGELVDADECVCMETITVQYRQSKRLANIGFAKGPGSVTVGHTTGQLVAGRLSISPSLNCPVESCQLDDWISVLTRFTSKQTNRLSNPLGSRCSEAPAALWIWTYSIVWQNGPCVHDNDWPAWRRPRASDARMRTSVSLLPD
jgi:hypothetical protein